MSALSPKELIDRATELQSQFTEEVVVQIDQGAGLQYVRVTGVRVDQAEPGCPPMLVIEVEP